MSAKGKKSQNWNKLMYIFKKLSQIKFHFNHRFYCLGLGLGLGFINRAYFFENMVNTLYIERRDDIFAADNHELFCNASI